MSGTERQVLSVSSTTSRALSAVLAVGTGTVLTLAAWLKPSVEGHGTHLQLGLRECSFLGWTGWPCPMCGATTTFSLMAHARVVEAVVNQPFATLLFVMTVGVFAVSVAEAVQPRRRWSRLSRWLEPREGWLAVGFLGFMLVAWAYKAALMGRVAG